MLYLHLFIALSSIPTSALLANTEGGCPPHSGPSALGGSWCILGDDERLQHPVLLLQNTGGLTGAGFGPGMGHGGCMHPLPAGLSGERAGDLQPLSGAPTARSSEHGVQRCPVLSQPAHAACLARSSSRCPAPCMAVIPVSSSL